MKNSNEKTQAEEWIDTFVKLQEQCHPREEAIPGAVFQSTSLLVSNEIFKWNLHQLDRLPKGFRKNNAKQNTYFFNFGEVEVGIWAAVSHGRLNLICAARDVHRAQVDPQ